MQPQDPPKVTAVLKQMMDNHNYGIPGEPAACFISQCIGITSVKIIKNEVGCGDDTVPKTVETRRHCEED